MKSTSWKDNAEIVGIGAIVFSLMLVAYELQQNAAVTTAKAIFEINTSVDAAYRARAQDPILDELVDKGHSDPDALSERERSQFAAWLRADMNLIEAIWFYYDNGLIADKDFDGYKAATCSRVATRGGREYWAAEAKFFAHGFRDSIEKWCF